MLSLYLIKEPKNGEIKVTVDAIVHKNTLLMY